MEINLALGKSAAEGLAGLAASSGSRPLAMARGAAGLLFGQVVSVAGDATSRAKPVFAISVVVLKNLNVGMPPDAAGAEAEAEAAEGENANAGPRAKADEKSAGRPAPAAISALAAAQAVGPAPAQRAKPARKAAAAKHPGPRSRSAKPSTSRNPHR